MLFLPSFPKLQCQCDFVSQSANDTIRTSTFERRFSDEVERSSLSSLCSCLYRFNFVSFCTTDAMLQHYSYLTCWFKMWDIVCKVVLYLHVILYIYIIVQNTSKTNHYSLFHPEGIFRW